MTGDELKTARFRIGDAIGEHLSFADMARLVGLADPAGNGKDTVRKWKDGDGPSGPVAALVEPSSPAFMPTVRRLTTMQIGRSAISSPRSSAAA